MFVSYDLAKAIQRDRLDRSIAEMERRMHKLDERTKTMKETVDAVSDAEVVELVLPTSCESDQIGA